MADAYDAIIIGSGPNGLAAAITLAQAGQRVLVLEAKATVGGGMRTAELTLPEFKHDLCSAIHPLGMGSPFFRSLPLERYGLEWIQPPLPLAHPLEGGRAATLAHDLEATATGLGADAPTYRRLIGPLVQGWNTLAPQILGPLLRFPRSPVLLARFGLPALMPAMTLARWGFKTEEARALFAGLAGHSMLPLEAPGSAAIGLVLGLLAHAVGWPIPKGGSQMIADALAAYLQELGGEIITAHEVTLLEELPSARVVICDVTPRQLLRLAGERLPLTYRQKLERYRKGPGVFKVDYALNGPIPWQAEVCSRAGTVHVGGTLADIALSERAMSQGRHPERPYLLVAQQSLFDPTRAPAGKHTAWAYCHVPNGSTIDMTERIEAQLERFAPGFKARVLARHTMNAQDLEGYNPNYLGGDINGGAQTLWQTLARPTLSLRPYRTPARGLYLCSSSTPPGGGVHGMCGYHAAQAALAELGR